MKVTQLIEDAKKKYPFEIYYNGRLDIEEIKELEKFCYVDCLWIYMNGGNYSIRYKGEQDESNNNSRSARLF